MSKPIHAILMLAWALWLGGMVAMIIFVMRLFAVSRPVAVEAAPVLFMTFASYQLIVGLIACAAGTLLAVVEQRRVYAILTLVMLLALTGAMLNRSWTHEMESIRAAGQSGGPEFKALHGKTSATYTTEAVLLAIAGVGFILMAPTRRTGQGTAAAQGFPVSPVDRSPAPPGPTGHALPR